MTFVRALRGVVFGCSLLRGRKLQNRVPRASGHFLFTCSDTFAVGFINLAIVHSVTNRLTDRQTDDNVMPIAEHNDQLIAIIVV